MKNIVRFILIQLVLSQVWVAAQDCGAILTEPSGSFSSANFPAHYANNSDCTWILFTQPDNTISLTFEAFVLDTSDYVTVNENLI
jgi:CUB domain